MVVSSPSKISAIVRTLRPREAVTLDDLHAASAGELMTPADVARGAQRKWRRERLMICELEAGIGERSFRAFVIYAIQELRRYVQDWRE